VRRGQSDTGRGSPIVNDADIAALADIVFDCSRPATIARFWASVLDDYEVAPYDDEELARLRSLGISDTEDDPTVVVERSDGRGPRLWFQLVPEPKERKNRVHLELRSEDVDADVARLIGLGARILDDRPNDGLVVLQDPEGNEFCLLRPRPGDRWRSSREDRTSFSDGSLGKITCRCRRARRPEVPSACRAGNPSVAGLLLAQT
jgi:hypothetical protein